MERSVEPGDAPRARMDARAARLANRLLGSALLVAVACWSAAAVRPEGRWAVLLDNIDWTVSFGAAALVAWLGSRGAGGVARRVRTWFALGLSALFAGQLVWDVQVFVGWNPFPAPSDVLYLLLAPCFAVGVWQAMRAELPGCERRSVLLDVVGFGLAATSLALTLYLPHGVASTPWQLAVLTLYPVLLLTSSAGLLVVWLHLRQRWTSRNLALLLGLMGHGACWMLWNLGTLKGSLGIGAPLNLAFSLMTLLLGWGSHGWMLQRDESERFDQFCEGLLRQLPLAMTAIASVTLGLLYVVPDVPASARQPLLVLGLTVLALAIVRQTRQLRERERMLVAERNASESAAQLRHLAHHDPLTGLPNLTLLRDRVEQALADARRSGTRVALLFIDLDHFKEVNDTLGHALGDRLLCHVADAFRKALRGGDTVSRQGGDEFIVVLRDITDLRQVGKVAETLLGISRRPVTLEGYELQVGMSVGIAIFPGDGQDFATLQQQADTAMYKAKSEGRGTYRFYDAQMNRESAERLRLRATMSRGLARREFTVHYQPQVDLRSGAVVGAEALLRWMHPQLGLIGPGSFIPVAEDSGLIVELGGWALLRACLDAAAWTSRGLPPLTVAVNLSVVQMRRGNFEQVVQQALRESGLPAQRLELEVTESVLLADRDRVLATIDALRALGVRIALDDFGTGYASLSHVHKLAARTLKIDRSLVADLDAAGTGTGVVRAAIDMARALGMTPLAEGVETPAQRDQLRALGCEQAQGYLFGRPVPVGEFEVQLAAVSAGAAAHALRDAG